MTEILLTLSVVILALICFVKEWFPADITAIFVMVLLMTLGLVSPEEGVSGFSNNATITVMAMFILSGGIARTGAVTLISDFFNRRSSQSAPSQILVMGAVIAPISAFINNTAVVAVFLPVIENWCRQQKISPSKLLMPLSFLAILGGMLTLIGTSTNILASGLSEELGYQPFGLFQFTGVGLITCTVGLLYLAFVAPKLLSDRRPTDHEHTLESYQAKAYISEIVIPPGSKLIGQTLSTSRLQRKFDLDVLELIRGKQRLQPPIANELLQAGDVFLVRASQSCLLDVQSEKSIQILPAIKFDSVPGQSPLDIAEQNLAEVLLLPSSALVGSTLKETRFRQRYNATVLAIQRGEEILLDRLGKIPLKFGDMLLLRSPQQSLVGLKTNSGFVVIEKPDLEVLRRDRALVAVAILIGVVVAAAFEWLPILISAWVGVALMLLTGCLKPGEIYSAVRWDVIFLLAGLIPLGIAMENSGATQWVADQLSAIGTQLSPYWVLTLLFVMTSLVTEIISNNACVVLLLPVAVKLAVTLGLNPYAFMFIVTFAASNSFMTPIGYQTNTMIYGPGGYRFSDFIRVGGPLNLIMAIITPPLIIMFFGLEP